MCPVSFTGILYLRIGLPNYSQIDTLFDISISSLSLEDSEPAYLHPSLSHTTMVKHHLRPDAQGTLCVQVLWLSSGTKIKWLVSRKWLVMLGFNGTQSPASQVKVVSETFSLWKVHCATLSVPLCVWIWCQGPWPNTDIWQAENENGQSKQTHHNLWTLTFYTVIHILIFYQPWLQDR